MKTKCLILIVLAAALVAASATATTVIPPTFDELVGEAQLIFEGTVTDVRCEWTGEGMQRGIVSYVTFTIQDVLKGSPGPTYTLQMVGGTIGNETIAIADAPIFKKGDSDILFVENNGHQFIPLVGIMYGRFRVQSDLVPGREFVTDYAGGPVAGIAQLRPADFKNAIRAKLVNRAH
jgi:hypothetical protein